MTLNGWLFCVKSWFELGIQCVGILGDLPWGHQQVASFVIQPRLESARVPNLERQQGKILKTLLSITSYATPHLIRRRSGY